MLRLFFIFLCCFYFLQVFSQSKPETIDYSKLLKYKIDEDRFEVGWVLAEHGIPWFRDYTKTQITTQFVDPKKDSVFYTPTDPKINGLKIIAAKITLDKKSRLLQLSGQITGAWESVIPTEFEIYIGIRNDTVSNLTLSPSLHGTVYYNGVKLDSTVIVDRVPAFYLTDIKKFNAYRGPENLPNTKYKEMLFDINSIIDEKSILVFGLLSRYAEIFEVGRLLTQ